MLLFSTILSIKPTLTRDDFIRLVIRWNQESTREVNVIPGIEWHGERNVRYGNEKVWLDIEEYRNKNIIAVRFEKREDDGVIWDTDYVMNFDEYAMAIRLDRSFSQDAPLDNPGFSTPHFITLLIENGYLADDEDLPVLRTPIYINEANIALPANVINEYAHYRLPVVYVSRTFHDEEPVDVRKLAGRLKGVAHVLVQESNVTNTRLRKLTDGENEYYGAIGVYYPNAAVPHRKYLYREADGFDTILAEKVVSSVIRYNNQQLTDVLYTWQGVNNAILRDRYASQQEKRLLAEEAKERTRRETDELLEGVDDDFRRLQTQINELTRANEALQYENQGLKARLSAEDVPVLFLGDEFEFYEGEIREILLDVLTDAAEGLPDGSRKKDVINDIAAHNDFRKVLRKNREEIKRLLNSYSRMSSALQRDLEALGFNIKSDENHYKIVYHGDERYMITLSKTPSDVRTGRNAVQTIIREVF